MNERLAKIKRLIERIIRIEKQKQEAERLAFSIIPSCEIVLKEIAQIETGAGMQAEEYRYIPDVGKVYRHYKGNLYTVEAVAFEATTIEPVVVYRSLENGIVWVRSLVSFTEILEHGYRFEPQKTAQ